MRADDIINTFISPNCIHQVKQAEIKSDVLYLGGGASCIECLGGHMETESLQVGLGFKLLLLVYLFSQVYGHKLELSDDAWL